MSNSSSVIVNNRKKGIIGETIIKQIYKQRGSKIIPTNHGSDFIAINKIFGTRKLYREYVEVKTGYSRQTKKQKITMKEAIRKGHNYTIYHISDSFLKKFVRDNEGIMK